MTENKKNIQNFKEFDSDLNSILKILDGIPNTVPKQNVEQNDTLIDDNKYHDDYADFTEFEDENGNIQLIKYSTKVFEFRGNKYCKYVLCNEKTGNREDGIAQIKGGQYIHIKDEERKQKIIEFIDYKIQEVKDTYCKNLAYLKGYKDLKYVGHTSGKIFKQPIYILYQIGASKQFYFYKIEDESGFFLNFNNINDLYKFIQGPKSNFEKNPNYTFPSADTLYDLIYSINGEDKKLIKISTVKEYDEIDEESTTYILYKIINSNDYVVLQEDENGDTSIETDIQYIKSIFDLKELMQNGNLITEDIKSSYPILSPDDKDILLKILFIPFFILLLYPVTELIMWIIAHVFSQVWSDKFSAVGVTDFATKYLPYAYHPKLNWFSYFSVNFLCIAIFSFLSYQYRVYYKKTYLIIGNILAIGFIYAMFVPNIFDFISTIAAWLLGIVIIITVLLGIGSRE